MSEFSHIEITIETVATDGTRTRTTRWACPSVEMGSTRDRRVQLRFAGAPVVVAGEAEQREEATARDVATDPRVEDRVTVGGWRRTVEAVEPGRILVYSGPRFYWRPEEWAFLCQMPGAVIERAPE